MSLHPQSIEKDGRKGFVVLPDEEFAASRLPSFPLFISAFSSARSLPDLRSLGGVGVAGGAAFTPVLLLLFVSAFQNFSFYPSMFNSAAV